MYHITTRKRHHHLPYIVYKNGRPLKHFSDKLAAMRFVNRHILLDFFKSPLTNPLWALPLKSIHRILLHKGVYPSLESAQGWVDDNGLCFTSYEGMSLFHIAYWNISNDGEEMETPKSWYEYLTGDDGYRYYRHLYDSEKLIFIDVQYKT